MIHFANILTGAMISDTLIQVVSAFSGGLIMGALYLCTGSVIPCIAIHFIHDILTRMVGTGEIGTWNSIWISQTEQNSME